MRVQTAAAVGGKALHILQKIPGQNHLAGGVVLAGAGKPHRASDPVDVGSFVDGQHFAEFGPT